LIFLNSGYNSYPSFTEEETDTERLSNLPEVTQLESYGITEDARGKN
jgi:hypothetical protein